MAIECGDDRVTYAALHERVNRFGSALRRLDVRPEERILLLLHDGPAFAYSFFGAIKAGIVPVPVNTLWKDADYRYVLSDSRATLLVVGEELLPRVARVPRGACPRLRHVVVVPSPVTGQAGQAGESAENTENTEITEGAVGFEELLAGGSPELDPEPTSRDDAAFWLYSSGSTGAPKGCVHLQHDMALCAELFAKGVLGIREDDRCFSVPKLFFAYGLGNALYFPFAVGATSILWPGPPTPAHVYRIIESHRPTLFFFVPTGYAMLLATTREGPDFDLSSLRLASSAGESLPPALYDRFKERFGLDILDGIGSTEALHTFIANRPERIRPGSSGLIVPGYEARLLDDDGRPAAAGEVANLWIRGDSVCSCYWNQHEKSQQTIQGSWLRTGDKYSQDADGFYWYAGRTDDMMKVGGLWVSPVEVENALASHADVHECGVVACEDRDGLVKPLAFVVLRAGVSGTRELGSALQQHVRDRLAEYKRPRWVEFVPELPKTATGKIQRFKLRELASRQA
jgi:benzoate-CoA ligase